MSANNRREEEDFEMAEEDEPEYEVEAILEKKKIGPKWKYFIKWVGYPHEQNTWEPEENLNNVQEMLEEFEANWTRKQKEKEKKLAGPLKASITPIGGPLGILGTRPPLKESKISNIRKREDDEESENMKSNKKRKLDDEDSDSKPRQNLGKAATGAGVKNKTENSNGASAIISSNSKPLSEMLKSKGVGKSNNSHNSQPNSPLTVPNQVLSDGAIFLQDDDSSKIFGSLDQDDKPKRLLTAKLHTDTNEVKCLVEWEARKGGVKPADSFVSNKVLRQRCPQLLLDFYESRLRFPAGK